MNSNNIIKFPIKKAVWDEKSQRFVCTLNDLPTTKDQVKVYNLLQAKEALKCLKSQK